jgi:hypothetical protein
MVPEWDGHGRTVIEYLCSIAELIRLSPQMLVDLGTMAPLKFKDRAAKWWQTQSIEFRNSVSQNWELLYKSIQLHFLDENWVQKRTAEWEEMCFQQKGHEGEWPLDFIQRRILYHMFLFPEELDGTNIVARILRNAPDIWLGTINSMLYTDIFSLKAAVVLYCPTLMGNWNTAIKLGTLNQYYPRHRAHVAEVEDYASEEEEEEAPSELRTRTLSQVSRPVALKEIVSGRPDLQDLRERRGHPNMQIGPKARRLKAMPS